MGVKKHKFFLEFDKRNKNLYYPNGKTNLHGNKNIDDFVEKLDIFLLHSNNV